MFQRAENSKKILKRRTMNFVSSQEIFSKYSSIANWSYKAYSLFYFETGTTTTVFNMPDNLHG